MKMSDGLFLRCSRAVSKEYPEITYGEHIVDNTCMQLVMNPYQYDMLLLENFYGDIISDLCAGLVGGLGLVPGANFGHECAIFEAVHGSAPDIAERTSPIPPPCCDLPCSCCAISAKPTQRGESATPSTKFTATAPNLPGMWAAALAPRNSPTPLFRRWSHKVPRRRRQNQFRRDAACRVSVW